MLRRSMISLFASLFLVLPCGSAFADVILVAALVANPPDTPFLGPEAALGAPWRSYQLNLVATEGELVGAVDVTIDGPLHQSWTDTDADGITDPNPHGAAYTGRGDSRLTAPAFSPFGLGPSETNSKTGSPLASDPGKREHGLGGLRGAWGILNPTRETWLAYIVFRGDQLAQLRITVQAADPSGNILPIEDDFLFIPEPTSVMIVALGMIGLAGVRIRIR